MDTDGDRNGQGQRFWRRGDRAKISILQVFRTSFFETDEWARRGRTAEGESEVSTRMRQRREGVSEAALREHLQADLNSLLNTTRLGSAVDLEGLPEVAKSILNYGMQDLSDLSTQDLATHNVAETVRQTLLTYEPRLVPGSVEVKLSDPRGDARQRLSILVQGELMGDPVDIPLDFDAEVDLGVGKLKMSNLRVQM